MTIRIEIDGETVTCEEGRTLVDVAAEAGVYIPTLCYLPEHPALGTCRVCSVKVNGAVAAACAVKVSDGMRVEVDDPETTDARKALVEMLFSEGNHNCPSCEKSGRCTLQAVGYEVDMAVSRFPYQFPERVADHAADTIWLERDRCIFCQRCVEFVRDRETGKKIFSISGRGARCPHRDRCRTRQQDAPRTGPRGRRHLSRRNDPRKRGGLRRAYRRAALRRRIGEGPRTRTITEARKVTHAGHQ